MSGVSLSLAGTSIDPRHDHGTQDPCNACIDQADIIRRTCGRAAKPPATAPATPITMFGIGPYPPSLTIFPVSQPVINPTMIQDRKYIGPPFIESVPHASQGASGNRLW